MTHVVTRSSTRSRNSYRTRARPPDTPPHFALTPWGYLETQGYYYRNGCTMRPSLAFPLVATLDQKDVLTLDGKMRHVSLGFRPARERPTSAVVRNSANDQQACVEPSSPLVNKLFPNITAIQPAIAKCRGRGGGIRRTGHRSAPNAFLLHTTCNSRAICPSQRHIRVTHNPWVAGSSPARPTSRTSPREAAVWESPWCDVRWSRRLYVLSPAYVGEVPEDLSDDVAFAGSV